LVDDSEFFLEVFRSELLKHIDMQIDTAKSATEAISIVASLDYDLVMMDIMMPDLDGLSAIHQLREKNTTIPIVMMSAANSDALHRMGYDTQILDSVKFVTKPQSREQMKVVAEQLKNGMVASHASVRAVPNQQTKSKDNVPKHRIKAIGIVVSTGGPNTLVKILEKLPPDYPIPIIIVQHMSTGFIQSFVRLLCEHVKTPVKIVEQSQVVSTGIWIAPEGAHMIVHNGRMSVDRNQPPYKLFKPSGNLLLKSIAKEYRQHAVGMVLTGLGTDGVEGMAQISELGGYTIVQEPKSCIISGMVKATLQQTNVNQALTPEEIAAFLLSLIS
jgi:two-component system chemotaxis response regulator CheB